MINLFNYFYILEIFLKTKKFRKTNYLLKSSVADGSLENFFRRKIPVN